MLLRLILHQLLRQQAESSLRQAMERSAQDRQAGAGDGSPDASHRGAEAESAALPPVEIAIIFKTSLEAGGTIDRLQSTVRTRCLAFDETRGLWRGKQVVIAVPRGEDHAVDAVAEDLISFHQPTWVISAGFSAALKPSCSPGTRILADPLWNTRGDEIRLGLQVEEGTLSETPLTVAGPLLTVEQPLRSKQEREQVVARFPACAADQESFPIAAVCRDHAIRCMAIRIITDAFDDEWPAELLHLQRQTTWAAKLGAAAGGLMKRPGVVKEFWKLKQQALEASDDLARFLAGVIGQLP